MTASIRNWRLLILWGRKDKEKWLRIILVRLMFLCLRNQEKWPDAQHRTSLEALHCPLNLIYCFHWYTLSLGKSQWRFSTGHWILAESLFPLKKKWCTESTIWMLKITPRLLLLLGLFQGIQQVYVSLFFQ